MKAKTKKIIFLTTGTTILTASVVTPIVILNQKDDVKNQDEKDVNKVFKILEEKNDKTIVLSSDSTGKIIINNQEKIVAKIKTLIGEVNLNDVKIEVLMKKDTNVSTTAQKIIIKLTKNEVSKEIKDFLVKRDFTADEDIIAIKNILDAKNNNDLIITIPSDSIGNIIGNTNNKNAIEKQLRKLVDPSNTTGEASHASLRGVTIEVSMDVDASISTTLQNIIVSISKSGGTALRTSKTFQVKKDFTADEDIEFIKNILDAKTGNDLIITLPSDSRGNIKNKTNKNAIEKKLRILVDSSNKNGDPNHPSLRGTLIEISTNSSFLPIAKTPRDIIVSISKTNGTTLTTTKTFQVKRDFTNDELDIKFIKNIFNTKTGDDLIITLPSNSSGNIIGNATNKNAVIKELRKLIDPSNKNGDSNHPSLRGTKIDFLILNDDDDAPISTTAQEIAIEIIKNNLKNLESINPFYVKRDFTVDEDIIAIKNILDAKTGNNLIITIPSDSTGNIIGNANNKNAIEKQLRKLVDPSNTTGEASHASLRGVTIEISMNVDASISTTLQNIIVSIIKTGGRTLTTTKTFQIKRDFNVDEDIEFIKNILDAKTNDDLIIILPSDSSGNIIENATNKNEIEKQLRKLIDPANTNGDLNHASLRGVAIEVSMDVDAPISTILQNIIVSISKSGGTALRTTKTFQVKKGFTNAQKITNYFAEEVNKNLIIAGEDDLDTKTKILDAIKNYLANDDRNLWTSEIQNLITIHSTETQTSITKDGPTITYSIAYNDDLGNPQKVDLTINHITPPELP